MALPANVEPTAAWREIRAELRRIVGQQTYDIWLASLEVRDWDGIVLWLQGPPATQPWVAKRFGKLLESCAAAAFGSAIKIAFAPTGGAAASPQTAGGSKPAATDNTTAHFELTGANFNPRYSFEQFIIGDGNRMAHAAALAVAEWPGGAYNPLFLQAPPGLGKTHLLHAIGNYVTAFGGGATVRYTTVEAFTNHFITALGSRSLDRFKRAYRDVDVLLIDDVQFLASKAKTEEEFFHTFNALYESNRQLVITCDRLPRQLDNIEDRLRERFESGMVAELAAPDFLTRVAILRKRAALDGIAPADPAVFELIAERVTDNIRTLEGALIRVVAYHSLTRRPIDLDLARTVLDTLHPAPSQRPRFSIPDLQGMVSRHYGISIAELTSASRAARIAWPRQVAIYLAREVTGASLNAIGETFGGRNHATVLHACRRVSERMNADQQVRREVEQLRQSASHQHGDRAC